MRFFPISCISTFAIASLSPSSSRRKARTAATRSASASWGHAPAPPSHAATADRNASPACAALICGIAPIFTRVKRRESAAQAPRRQSAVARSVAAQHPNTSARAVPGGTGRTTPSVKSRPATKGGAGAALGGAASDARAGAQRPQSNATERTQAWRLVLGDTFIVARERD